MNDSSLPVWITPGARFRLIQMGDDDPCPVAPGSTGTIDSILDFGPVPVSRWHFNVTWDPHVKRSLNLAYPADRIEPE